MSDSDRPALAGVHHLKFAVADLDVAQRFYADVFGAERIAQADHVDDDGRLYAVIMSVPGIDPLLELRLNPAAAARQAGFDPVTIAVDDLAHLDAWTERLDRLGVDHSARLAGIQAWLIVFADPDGRRLRLYTRQQHGPEVPETRGDPWLSEDPA